MPDNKTTLLTILLFISGYTAVRLINGSVLGIINNAGFYSKNYRGQEIPTGAGVILILGSIIVFPLFFYTLPGAVLQRSAVFLLALSVFTLLGLIDDIWGNGHCRGFKGHLQSILAGRPTTGAIKAAGGGLAALYIAFLNASQTGGIAFLSFLDALVLSLSVNTLNLMDLRPGRAGKTYLALAAVLLLIFSPRAETIFLALTAGCLVAYLPADLQGRAMMGDAGANALGAVLGLSAVWLLGPEAKTVYLFFLAAVNLMAERCSLTSLIASNKMLNYIDMLGRSDKTKCTQEENKI